MMTKLGQGDRSAFDYVYQHAWGPCLSLARSFLSTEEDAKDAAQAAFLKVFSRAHQYDARKDALTWFFTLVVFECKTLHKRKLRRKEVDSEIEYLADEGWELERKVIEKKMRLHARELIKDLTPLDQKVIFQVINDENQDKGTLFRKRLERALKRFKQAWEQKYG